MTRVGAVSAEIPGVTIPYEAFPGSIGVLPGEEEVQKWKAREADLAAAKGVALGPSPGGAKPGHICGENGSHKDDCLEQFPQEKMEETWTFNNSKLVLKLYFLVL